MMLGLSSSLPCCSSVYQCQNPSSGGLFSPNYCDPSTACCGDILSPPSSGGDPSGSGSITIPPTPSGTSGNETPSCAADPGFTVGLESWGQPGQWSGNITEITTLSTWACYPMMNLGIVVAPLVAAAGIIFFIGRGSKRR